MVDGIGSTIDGIEYEGAIWLVPEWLPFPSEGYTKPTRMVRLDQFRFQRFDPPATGPGPLAGADFAVNDPLPKALFLGELTPQLKKQFVVLDRPDIRFRIGGTLQ
jgi:hypothetical protein